MFNTQITLVTDERIRAIEYEFGPPRLYSSTGQPLKLNERFFAGLYQEAYQLVFEPAERCFYQYCESTGLWQFITDDNMAERIARCSIAHLCRIGLPNLTVDYRFSKNVMRILKGLTEQQNFFQQAKQGYRIHCANCVLEYNSKTQTFDKQDFSPDDRSRNRTEIAYDPEAQAPEFLEKLLRPAMNKDDLELLQLYVGQCLLKDNTSQRFLIISGMAGAGKSTLVNVIEMLINHVNCTELRTDHMIGRFETNRFIGKTLLTGKDVRSNFLDTKGAAMLKALTGKDTLTTEFKGSNKTIDIVGNYNIIITSNCTLHVRLENDGAAWKRRMLWIRYDNPPPAHPIENFDKHLIAAEGSGILNWALEGAKETACTGWKIKLSEAQECRIDALLEVTDPVRLFVRDSVIPCEGKDISCNELWNAFGTYCERRELDPIRKPRFQQILPDILEQERHILMSHNIQRRGRSVRGYRGVVIHP